MSGFKPKQKESRYLSILNEMMSRKSVTVTTDRSNNEARVKNSRK